MLPYLPFAKLLPVRALDSLNLDDWKATSLGTVKFGSQCRSYHLIIPLRDCKFQGKIRALRKETPKFVGAIPPFLICLSLILRVGRFAGWDLKTAIVCFFNTQANSISLRCKCCLSSGVRKRVFFFDSYENTCMSSTLKPKN